MTFKLKLNGGGARGNFQYPNVLAFGSLNFFIKTGQNGLIKNPKI